MQRWVNDYRIAERVHQGYRPVLPMEIKSMPLSPDEKAILMEKTDADYKVGQKDKAILIDLHSPADRKDLDALMDMECKTAIYRFINDLTTWELFKMFVRSIFTTIVPWSKLWEIGDTK